MSGTAIKRSIIFSWVMGLCVWSPNALAKVDQHYQGIKAPRTHGFFAAGSGSVTDTTDAVGFVAAQGGSFYQVQGGLSLTTLKDATTLNDNSWISIGAAASLYWDYWGDFGWGEDLCLWFMPLHASVGYSAGSYTEDSLGLDVAARFGFGASYAIWEELQIQGSLDFELDFDWLIVSDLELQPAVLMIPEIMAAYRLEDWADAWVVVSFQYHGAISDPGGQREGDFRWSIGIAYDP